MRVYYYKSYRKLLIISPSGVDSFNTVIMDFIIDILSARDPYINKTCDTILILVNKFIKYVTYIVTIKDLKVDKFANII